MTPWSKSEVVTYPSPSRSLDPSLTLILPTRRCRWRRVEVFSVGLLVRFCFFGCGGMSPSPVTCSRSLAWTRNSD